MRHLVRVGGGVATIGMLLTLMAGTALAGGYAEVTFVDGTGEPSTAGEEREIRFSVLQHGVTAVDWGGVNLVAVNPDSGESVTVPATNQPGGRWSAVVTFPSGGEWQLTVTHTDLATPGPIGLTVAPSAAAMAWLPALLAVSAFAAVAIAVAVGMLRARSRPSTLATPVERPAGASG
jgi:hypothetical protein